MECVSNKTQIKEKKEREREGERQIKTKNEKKEKYILGHFNSLLIGNRVAMESFAFFFILIFFCINLLASSS